MRHQFAVAIKVKYAQKEGLIVQVKGHLKIEISITQNK